MIKEIAEMLATLLVGGITLMVVVFGFGMLVSLPVWLLWNWLCPSIFGLPTVTLLQAFGLSLLSGLLVKGGKAKAEKSEP